ncbi:DinB family protein [Rummeliibacillus sp. SL167]|uniref:DinB family protein n=1 Tax=Rummeliibacillus sp. SL167 TaxID=2579792 RepID=UPI0021036488|nr:DinB family protein [Rummeliibacillus sp. SL167]
MKEEIVAHYFKTIEWVKKLENLSEIVWRTPIQKDKWTIAEIIGHFKVWDTFVLYQRLPYIFGEKELPKAPNTNEVNAESAILSRKKAIEVTSAEFIKIRRNLITAIINLEDHLWCKEFYIGSSKYTLQRYFRGQIEHDLHHFEQVRCLLEKKGSFVDGKLTMD